MVAPRPARIRTNSNSRTPNTSSSSMRFILQSVGLLLICALFVHLEGSYFGGILRNNTLLDIDVKQNLRSTHDDVKQNLLVSDDWLDQKYDVCIVGAGLSGAVIAERYASVLQQSVLVLEKR